MPKSSSYPAPTSFPSAGREPGGWEPAPICPQSGPRPGPEGAQEGAWHTFVEWMSHDLGAHGALNHVIQALGREGKVSHGETKRDAAAGPRSGGSLCGSPAWPSLDPSPFHLLNPARASPVRSMPPPRTPSPMPPGSPRFSRFSAGLSGSPLHPRVPARPPPQKAPHENVSIGVLSPAFRSCQLVNGVGGGEEARSCPPALL